MLEPVYGLGEGVGACHRDDRVLVRFTGNSSHGDDYGHIRQGQYASGEDRLPLQPLFAEFEG